MRYSHKVDNFYKYIRKLFARGGCGGGGRMGKNNFIKTIVILV